jgi:hypothetical protein
MNATIIFGTKKLGQAPVETTNEKYPDLAVVTVEGQKGAKKSRRILLNAKAAELLNCELGSVQNLVFASVEMNENTSKEVLIANADNLGSHVDVTYKTTKNRVSYGGDSSEKGKAISSTHACNEIFSFLEKDDSSNIEFKLVEFESQEVEAYYLSSINSEVTINPEESPLNVIENNNQEMTGEELQSSISDEVLQAELKDPISFEVNDLDGPGEDQGFAQEEVEEKSEELVSEWD